MVEQLSGRAIIGAIKESGVKTIIALPDLTTSDGLLYPIAEDPELTLIRVCKEDEAIGIAAGLSYCGKRALIMMQHTGLLDSINALRAVAVEYDLPIAILVGLLNKEPGVPPPKSKVYGVRIVEPILAAMQVEAARIETDDDVAKISPAIERAYDKNAPTMLLIGRSPTP